MFVIGCCHDGILRRDVRRPSESLIPNQVRSIRACVCQHQTNIVSIASLLGSPSLPSRLTSDERAAAEDVNSGQRTMMQHGCISPQARTS
jgi:hypothetical protein